MVRFGEARSRRDLVWQGEAGKASLVELGFGESRSGEAGLVCFGIVLRGELGFGEFRPGEAGLACYVIVRRVELGDGEAGSGMAG